MSLGGAFGAFADGFATSRNARKDRELREKLDAKLDARIDAATKASAGGNASPMALGVNGMMGDAAGAPTTFEGGGNKDAFISAMMPHALRVSEVTGLDPRLIIAQSAQETGWGKSAPGNNFFGIKSHGKSGGGTYATTEYVNGKPVTITDSFRGYSDMGASADDYGRFLKENPRYRDMLSARGLEAQVAALGKSGYATDPNYAQTVLSIANGIALPTPKPPPTAEAIMNRWPRPLGVGPM